MGPVPYGNLEVSVIVHDKEKVFRNQKPPA